MCSISGKNWWFAATPGVALFPEINLESRYPTKKPGYKVVRTDERTCHNICCLISSSNLVAEGAE